MAQKYEYELGLAANRMVVDMLGLKKGENFVITADTESDERVVNAVARAAYAAGAIPMVIWLAAPEGVGKAADAKLPLAPLTAALSHADAWVEFNNQWLLYSTPFNDAMAANSQLRYLCLVGMNVDMMVRVIGRVDQIALKDLLLALTERTAKAATMRITTPAGGDLRFELEPKHKLSCDTGEAKEPGIFMLGGQICFIPKLDTIEGSLVFDGSLVPPCGLLSEPIHLRVEQGVVTAIEGGSQAREFEAWLKSFDDPLMFHLAHGCYGLNPGAKLSGDILEDERVFGCTEWGIGFLSPIDAGEDAIDAKSHTDGICLNSSVWLDGVQIMDQGKLIDPVLQALADKI